MLQDIYLKIRLGIVIIRLTSCNLILDKVRVRITISHCFYKDGV